MPTIKNNTDCYSITTGTKHEKIIKAKIHQPKVYDVLKDLPNRGMNPITFELTGDWGDDDLHLIPDIFSDKFPELVISQCVLIQNNKVITIYKK